MSFYAIYYLFDDTGDETGGDSTAAFTDVKALACVSDDGVVGLENHLDIVTGHDQLGGIGLALRPVEGSGLVYKGTFG